MGGFFMPVMVGSAAGYQCFNSALNLGFLPPPPGKFAGRERHRWRNATTSLFNAVIVSTVVVHCLSSHPDLWRDPEIYYTVVADVGLAVLSGYLIYDTWDILLYTGFVRKWSVVLHHVIMFFVCYILSTERVAIGTLIIALMTEISAIFLHSRQLLLIYGISKSSPGYRVHKVFNLATGITCRMMPICYAGYVSFTSRHTPSYLTVVLPLLTTIIIAINSTMIWRLIRSDFWTKNNDAVYYIMDN